MASQAAQSPGTAASTSPGAKSVRRMSESLRMRLEAARLQAEEAESSTLLELLYFDVAGKAEPIRLAAAYGGVGFKDVRMSREDFAAKKAAGELAFGQVPALRVGGSSGGGGGQLLVQSNAIIRYIAKLAPESGLYPADALLAARVDALLDQEADLRQGLTCSKYQERFGFAGALGGEGSAATTAVRAALNDDVLPRHLGDLERVASASGTGWLAGTAGPTVADFVVALSVEGLAAGAVDGISEDILARGGYAGLLALIGKVKTLPSTVAWYAAKEAGAAAS